jgi:hypothetical protein
MQKLPTILLAAAVLIFFAARITSGDASIHWDAADEFQPFQNYISEELHAGRIPFWTSHLWSGYPALADPQAGAWYPLNWPFFLLGVTPSMMEIENLLHVLIASFGAFFLAKALLDDSRAAIMAGLCYGLGGFFAGHASHTPMIQAAAWVPWILLCFWRAVAGKTVFYTGLGILAGSMMVLAGHFQTALYGFLGLLLFAIGMAIERRGPWLRLGVIAAAIPVGATLISCVATLPGLELALNSVRTGLTAATRHEGFLPPASLATLLYPNYYGVFDHYHGPEDNTQYYFYAGILLVPLAILGLKNARLRLIAPPIVLVPLWYALGSAAGLYLLMAQLPGFSNVRAPVNIWFLPQLGLAMLAAAGLAWVAKRWTSPWITVAILVITFGDLYYWNSGTNPLAYQRESYESTYGQGLDLFRKNVALAVPPGTRVQAPDGFSAFGPLNHPLIARTDATYGYGPLEIASYREYEEAMKGNPKLRNGLAVSRYVDNVQGQAALRQNPGMLDRVNFPKTLIAASTQEESKKLLATFDPAQASLVPKDIAALHQDPAAKATLTGMEQVRYRVHYQAATESLLRISSAFYPGWTASTNGKPLRLLRADHALMGVIVPPGEGDVTVEYHSTYFLAGVLISALSLLACSGLILRARR